MTRDALAANIELALSRVYGPVHVRTLTDPVTATWSARAVRVTPLGPLPIASTGDHATEMSALTELMRLCVVTT
jgi:hypothetical protein